MGNIPGVGPQAGRAAPPPNLSRSRAALLTAIEAQPGPITLTALVLHTGLHANTVREHLNALVSQDLVRRRRSHPSGRGRPAWLYEPTRNRHRSGSAEYAGLAATLAAAIATRSSSPHEDAVAAGTEWGRQLAAAAGPPAAGTQHAARQQVIEVLDQFGFGPQTGTPHPTVRLTRCPLLEAARRYPDVVCGVHLGIVRGALLRYDADPSAVRLYPFSEPGACRLELVAPSDGASH